MNASFARRALLLGAVSAVVLAGAAALGIARQPAEQAQKDLPPAEEIFERYIEAIGGADAIKGIRNRRIEGTFEGPPFSGAARLKIWADAPNKIHIAIREPLGIKLDIYYNGEYGWETIDGSPPRPIFGPRLVELAESAQFWGEADFRTRYTDYKTVVQGEINGKPVWGIEAVSKAGRPRRVFFEKESGLFVAEHSSVARATAQGTLEAKFVEVIHSNYTEIGGVLYPTRQVQNIDGDAKAVTLSYTSVRVNADDEHDYYPPGEQRAALEAEIENLRLKAAGSKAPGSGG